MRIGINGLGRIGRCVLRAVSQLHYDDIEVVAVNGPASIETHVHLLTYDSVHGYFPAVKQTGPDRLMVGKQDIQLFRHKQPENIPWKDLHVDIVLECSGKFKTRAEASRHLQAGAKKVIISAPSPDADRTIVYGVNHHQLQTNDTVISVGSCTTNCLAPIAHTLYHSAGIEKGFMTTIHAYTNDQNIMDNSHKDLRRARAATMSIVPAETGAAKALSLVVPELAGKLDGTAIRVPTPNVSMIDLTFLSKRHSSAEEINQIMEKAASTLPGNILSYSEKPLVSIDFNHHSSSAIFDATATKVTDGNFCRVAAWYDNEWGFSARMLDVARLLA